jgi:ABC-2 type transport system ATP-binding protein
VTTKEATGMPVIEVEHLHKQYRDQVAVDDLSFTVERNEIFGILGPNGAGKTITVEIIEGLRTPDGGTVRMLGLDPWKDRAELRRRVGVQLQESELPEKLKVWEAMELYSSFYDRPADWEPLLDDLGLADKRDTRYGKLSAARSSDCPSPWPWSGTPSWPSWTSSPPAWTRTRGATPGS